jgi:hypothetical protein
MMTEHRPLPRAARRVQAGGNAKGDAAMSSNVLGTITKVGPKFLEVRLRAGPAGPGAVVLIDRPDLPPHQNKFAVGGEIEVLPNDDGTYRYFRHVLPEGMGDP